MRNSGQRDNIEGCYLYQDHSETKGGRIKWKSYVPLGMILQMHCAVESSVAPRMGTCNRLTIRMVVKVLTLEVLFQRSAAGERLQTLHLPGDPLPRAKYLLEASKGSAGTLLQF